jgi:hypothetical protein
MTKKLKTHNTQAFQTVSGSRFLMMDAAAN